MWSIIGMHMVSLTQLYFLLPYHKTAKIWPQPKLVNLQCNQNHYNLLLHCEIFKEIEQDIFLGSWQRPILKFEEGFVSWRPSLGCDIYWYAHGFYSLVFLVIHNYTIILPSSGHSVNLCTYGVGKIIQFYGCIGQCSRRLSKKCFLAAEKDQSWKWKKEFQAKDQV